MLLFYYLQFGRFILLPPGCGKCDISRTPKTPRATPATTGKWSRATNSTNKKQGMGEKQILIGQDEEDKLERAQRREQQIEHLLPSKNVDW